MGFTSRPGTGPGATPGTPTFVRGNNTPADNFANPTDAIPAQAFLQAWDGAAWDLVRAVLPGDEDPEVTAVVVASRLQLWNTTESWWQRAVVTGGGGLSVGPQTVKSNNIADAGASLDCVTFGHVFTGTVWDQLGGALVSTDLPADTLRGAVVRPICARVGTQGNAWNNVVTAGASTAVSVRDMPHVSAFGTVSAATTISVEVSQNGATFYATGIQQVLAGAGDFYLAVPGLGASSVRLRSSNNVTATGTIAGKGS